MSCFSRFPIWVVASFSLFFILFLWLLLRCVFFWAVHGTVGKLNTSSVRLGRLASGWASLRVAPHLMGKSKDLPSYSGSTISLILGFSFSSRMGETLLSWGKYSWITTCFSAWEDEVIGDVWNSSLGLLMVNCPRQGSGSKLTGSIPSLIGKLRLTMEIYGSSFGIILWRASWGKTLVVEGLIPLIVSLFSG